MKQPGIAFDPHGVMESQETSILLPLVAGIAFNLLSLAIDSPNRIAVLGLVVGLLATLAWSERPLAWVIFVAVIAANPGNTTTPISINLFCGGYSLLLMRSGGWKLLPRLLQFAFCFALVSMAVSIITSLFGEFRVPSIQTLDITIPRPYMSTWSNGASLVMLVTQTKEFANYLLGPFLLIPVIFSRIRRDHDPLLLIQGLLFGLIVPTLLLFVLARVFGKAHLDLNAMKENMLNVSRFLLWNTDIMTIRTQVGIILAAFICASFAIALSPGQRWTRIAAAVCLVVAAYLLLVSGSVGSTLACGAGIALILALGMPHFSIKRYLVVMCIGAGIALAAWTVVPEGVKAYTLARYEERAGIQGSPVGDRADRWTKSFSYLMENPSGVGWSLYIEPLGIYPHNDYISYAIAYGLLCGLLYLACPLGLLFSFLVYRPSQLEPGRFTLALVGAGVTTVMLINSMSDHMTANRWYFNVIWSLIWFAFYASRPALGPSVSKIP